MSGTGNMLISDNNLDKINKLVDTITTLQDAINEECIEKGKDSVIILRESENKLIAISKTKLRKYVVEELCKGRKENIQFWWYGNNFANFVNGEVKYSNIETDNSDY